MIGIDAEPWLVLTGVTLAGRLALSVLPAGLPGLHGPRELAETWAASHVLGFLALRLQGEVFTYLDLSMFGVTPIVPWLVLLAMRWVTFPGSMVPRYAPKEEPSGTVAIGLALAIAALLVRLVALDGAPLASLPSGLHWIALTVLLGAGQRTARRSPLWRRALTLGWLATPAIAAHAGISEPHAFGALLAAAGGTYAVAWLRRADRRGLLLSVFAFAGLPLALPSAWLASLIALAALVTATASPARLTAARWAGGASMLTGIGVALTRNAAEPLSGETTRAGLFWVALLLVACLGGVWRARSTPRGPGIIDPPRSELAFGCVCVAGWLVAGELFEARALAVWLAAPLGALFSGLAACPTERP